MGRELRREGKAGLGAAPLVVISRVAGLRRCGPGAGLVAEALGQILLDPEAMALLGDQPGDRGDGFRHLEGGTEGAGEGRQLGRQAR